MYMRGLCVIGVTIVAFSGCGMVRVNPISGLVSSRSLHNCLRVHGIAHPEDTGAASKQALAIPLLTATYGVPVPRDVAPSRYQRALWACGERSIHVGQTPITLPALREEVVRLRLCLAQNGYVLPTPDFSGKAAVLDTSRIDVQSVRWAATVRACEITNRHHLGRLNKRRLLACFGVERLEGTIKGNAELEQRYLELASCLQKTS